jgi:hypothetical protein
MGTKQIKMTFQVENTSEESNSVQVRLNGVTKFEGTLPETGTITNDIGNSTFTSITFDQDVADWVNNETDKVPVNIPLEITVTGASIALKNAESNYNVNFTNTGTEEEPVWSQEPGDVDTYQLCNIVEQPTWNGEPLLGRYDIQYHNGTHQETGPGVVLVLSGETVQTVLKVARFNNSV